jgi:hypothetical protein
VLLVHIIHHSCPHGWFEFWTNKEYRWYGHRDLLPGPHAFRWELPISHLGLRHLNIIRHSYGLLLETRSISNTPT